MRFVNRYSLHNLFCSTRSSFLVFLCFIAVLKRGAIFLPPVWDESVSIFPAADFLVNHGFNFLDLLQAPERGAHWFSLMSFVTAFVMRLLGAGTQAWAALHVLQWFMGAALAVVFFRLLVPLVGEALAVLSAFLLISMPAALAQLGFMYSEVPLALLCLAAVRLHLDGRTGAAALMCAAACFAKEAGILMAIALGVSVFMETDDWRKAVQRSMIYVVPALAVVIVAGSTTFKGSAGAGGAHDFGMPLLIAQSLKQSTHLSLSFYPDHLILLGVSLLLASAHLGSIVRLRARLGAAALRERKTRVLLVSSLFMLFYVIFFYFTLPVFWSFKSYLPRYLVQALPYVIVLLVVSLQKSCQARTSRFGADAVSGSPGLEPRMAEPGAPCGRIPAALLCALLLLALLNHRGVLYPVIPFNDISLSERSEEYVDGYLATRDCLAALEELVPANERVFMDSFTHNLTQNPNLGYVRRRMENAVDISKEKAISLTDNAGVPTRFSAVYNYPWSGGEKIKRILNKSRESGSRLEAESIAEFSKGTFRIQVYRFGPT